MSNEHQNRPQIQWQDIKLFKDEKTGVQVRVQKGNHARPVLSMSIGFTHKQLGAFTPYTRNVIPYHTPEVDNIRILDAVIEGLQNLRDAVNTEVLAEIKALEAGVSKHEPRRDKPHHQHGRKPGEPGKTGKTARKKAKQQGARQTNGAPPPPATPAT